MPWTKKQRGKAPEPDSHHHLCSTRLYIDICVYRRIPHEDNLFEYTRRDLYMNIYIIRSHRLVSPSRSLTGVAASVLGTSSSSSSSNYSKTRRFFLIAKKGDVRSHRVIWFGRCCSGRPQPFRKRKRLPGPEWQLQRSASGQQAKNVAVRFVAACGFFLS